MSKQAYKVCCCFRRRFKFREAEAPDEIKALFGRYSENGLMTVDHLHKFLKEVQGEETVTMEEAESAMESIIKDLKHLHVFHRKVLNLEAFFRYLFGDANYPLISSNKVHHDMTAPLSHYFVYTSHNSYLTGNQISSDCSDVPIIKALEKGVRVIELDMWPNSTKDNVDIYHGRTLTTPVDLIKCLSSIRKHAFVASEFPVILTLEDHLTPDLQAKVAEMVTHTFGDVLFSSGSECSSEFPSPESLKRKIIISTKPPKEYLETKSIKERDDHSRKAKNLSEEAAWGKEVSDIADHLKIRNELQNEPDDGEFQDEEDAHEDIQELQQNAAPKYKNLIAIHARKRKGGIKDWLKIDPNNVTRISLSEEKFEKAVLSHGGDIVRFTQRNLLRIFPKAMRLDSSNYNPLIGWTHGAQMVALNMQGYGRYLWLMQGLFRANGGCGYVKKPDILLQIGPHNEVFDPKRALPVKKTLKVKVYMGDGWNLDFHHTHFDMYFPPDFYVKVGIAGVSDDSAVKKTKIVEDNWVPTWEEEFEFQLRVPELALLRIEVHEYDMSEKDDFGGQTCLPVSELREGIRGVPLYNQKGEKYKSVKLLMRFDFL
ncbi:phosphoinositide phospholipase C 2-like isoform X1 [Coffea arabica]|uniref:Phosphoinositide phospholipase C n=1 Tax=Coffea arabica TaxID=13443 RepID=A0A6P6T3S0_COFAR